MKTIGKAMLFFGMLLTGLTNAQSSKMNNMLKLGINGGMALPTGNASATVGFDMSYQNLVVPGVGFGIATGYNHYFGKENQGNKNQDFGVLPIAALFRLYPKQTGFYFGSDLGYGFITGNGKVASNATIDRPDGGFYIKPELGYHNRDWNFAVQYQKVFTGSKGQIGEQKYSASSLGVGIAYNIPLGK